MSAHSDENPAYGDGNDHEAFIRLFSRHQRQIHAFIVTLIADSADVEEVLQETSIILWSKFSQFRPDGSFLNWACGIARLEVLRFFRQNRHRMLSLEEPVIEQIAAERMEMTDPLENRRVALAECKAKLPDPDQDLIDRCYQSGSSFKRVAQELGRPVNSVYKSLGRIRRWLLRCIDRAVAAQGRA